MTIRVLLFGHYRDAVEGGSLTLSLPAGATVADAASEVSSRDIRLADLPQRVRAAIGESFATFDRVLSDGDEVAFLPPMSGG